MRERRESRPGGRAAVLAAALAFGLFGAAGAWGQTDASQAHERMVLEPSPGSRAIEPFLARLWDSGFFRRNDAVRREILNNNYDFLGPKGPLPPKGIKGLGCYSHSPGDKDTIFLRKDLFSRYEVGLEGITLYENEGRRVLPVLVHEICHDLWMNVLDDRERAAFAREGEDLMEEFCMAQTADGRRLFRIRYGDDIGDPGCRRSYSEIEGIRAARLPRPVGAHELFAWLAERLFLTKRTIPRPLRKYYSCILAGIPAADEPARLPAGRER